MIATPLQDNKPESIAPKLIAPFKYSSVKITLDAQLGIKPIKLDRKGEKREFFNKNFATNSSPT